MSNNNRGALFTGLMVGTAIGSVVGLLVAPKKGQETRKVLKKVAGAVPELTEDLTDTVKLQTNRLTKIAATAWDETIDRFQQALVAGVVASQSVQNQRNINSNEPKPASIVATSSLRQ